MAPTTPALMRAAGWRTRSTSVAIGIWAITRRCCCVPLPMTTLGRCLVRSAPDFFSRSGTGGRLLVCSDLRPGQLARRLCRPGLLRLSPLYPAVWSVFQEVRAARSVLYGAIIIKRQFKDPISLYRTWRQPLRGSKAVLLYQAPYGPTMPVRRSEILGGNGFDPH